MTPRDIIFHSVIFRLVVTIIIIIIIRSPQTIQKLLIPTFKLHTIRFG